MQGWLQYIKETSQNIQTYTSWIPYIGEVIAAITEYVIAVAEYGEGLLSYAIPVMTKGVEIAKMYVTGAHYSLQFLIGTAANSAATDVLAANRVEFASHHDAGGAAESRGVVRAATWGLNNGKWFAFTKQYSEGGSPDGRDYAQDVLLRSRDEFTGKSRPGAPWMTPPLGIVGFEKNGGTSLVDYKRWESQDTYEFYEWGFCKRWKKCYQPVGWGRSNLDRDGDDGNVWSPGRAAQENAQSNGDTNNGWSGVPELFDVAERNKDDPKARAKLGVDFIVAAKRDKAATLTTSTIGMGKAGSSVAGSPEMKELQAGDQISALGKARVSFQRPQSTIGDKTANALFRYDGAKEYGSLYSPYWQARLVDITVSERTAYMVALGMKPADAAAAAVMTPGAQ